VPVVVVVALGTLVVVVDRAHQAALVLGVVVAAQVLFQVASQPQLVAAKILVITPILTAPVRAKEVTRVQRAARALAVAMVSSSSTTEQAAQPQAPRSTGFTFQLPMAPS
jgi:hypothetical protein